MKSNSQSRRIVRKHKKVKRSRKSVKRSSKRKPSRKSVKKLAKRKRSKKSLRGGGCQTSNEYLFVKGIKLPESEFSTGLEIDDQFARLNQNTEPSNNVVVNHPHLINKYN